jgi:hypothetical protein
MDLLTKKCDVCGTKIKKLNHWWWDIFSLKEGRIIKCSKCGTEYNTLKIVQFFGRPYGWFYIWMLSILGLTLLIWEFNKDLGGEVWFYAVAIYVAIEFFMMVLLPLKKIENKNEE